jgi:type I restriction enzyme S subunit
MKRWIIGGSEITLTREGVESSPAKIVPPGSVLLVVRSGVLKHTLPVALTTTPVTRNQDMKALIPSSAVDGGYLARLVKARQAEVLGWVRATTADNFPIEKLLDLQIDLPRVDEQRRIAAILDQADALRAKRRQALAHLDAFTHSIFHQMFSRDTPRARLGDLARTSSGGTPDRSVSEFFGGGIPWVKSGELHTGSVTSTEETLTARQSSRWDRREGSEVDPGRVDSESRKRAQ